MIPLFWTSGDVCPGFQSQAGFLRFTSGATPADLLAVKMAAEPFRSTYLRSYRNRIARVYLNLLMIRFAEEAVTRGSDES